MSENKKHRFFFDGEQNESLFWTPFISYFRANELPNLFKKVEKTNDHRLLEVTTALLVENRLDKFNTKFFPKYSKLLESSNFTFSMKINLVEALGFIPPLILRAAHLLRKIRNEFAHDLEKEFFTNLDKKFIDLLEIIRNETYHWEIIKIQSEEQIFEAFKQVSFFCIAGIDHYTVNVDMLRREISKAEFIKSLERMVNEVNEIETKNRMSQPPISVEGQGKLKIEIYEGIKVISDADKK